MMQPTTDAGPHNPKAEPRTKGNTLITANRIKDTAVYNSFGDKIGTVADMSIERSSGRVVYALMSFGGFLGMGEKFHPLPWDVLRYNTERDGYVIPLTKEELANAPSYSSAELTAYGGEDIEYRDSVRSYYSRFPPLA